MSNEKSNEETITPTLYTKIDAEDRDTWGGKACSLAALLAHGYNVPLAWVIPCSASLTRPKVDLQLEGNSSFPGDHYYAIRSGAPISMPGLLETKLNVTFSKIPEAIKSVWDSWNSPGAIAYRDANKISHSLGTAVIIQRMVAPKWSGVAFTADPNSPKASAEFNPRAEFITGLGTRLVNGSVTPMDAAKHYSYWSRLKEHLQKIHADFGPSDVEWCHGVDGYIYFVQQRPIKFAAETQAVDLPEHLKSRVVAIGTPIGAPGQLTIYFKAPEVIHVSSFRPELYPKMMGAKAIFTQFGGALCHAAILGRSLGIPVISGIGSDVLHPHRGNRLWIDGSKGIIAKPTRSDKTMIFSAAATTLAPLPPPPPPSVEHIMGLTHDPATLLLRFYGAQHRAQIGEITAEQKAMVVNRIAHTLGSYLYIISMGELRHRKWTGSTSLAAFNAYEAKLKDAGIGTRGGARVPYISHHVPKTPTLDGAIKLLALGVEGFKAPLWDGASLGGPKWARIAQLALDYYQGKINAELFADQTFNLHHNCSNIFGKVPQVTSLSQALLNARAQGLAKLQAVAAAEYTTSATLSELEWIDKPWNDAVVPAVEKEGI